MLEASEAASAGKLSADVALQPGQIFARSSLYLHSRPWIGINYKKIGTFCTLLASSSGVRTTFKTHHAPLPPSRYLPLCVRSRCCMHHNKSTGQRMERRRDC